MKLVDLRQAGAKVHKADLEDIVKRFAEGEFDSILLVCFNRDNTFLTREVGDRKMNRLEQIGILESLKRELLETM